MAFVRDLNKKLVRSAGVRREAMPTFQQYSLEFQGESSYGIPRTFCVEVAALSDVEAWTLVTLHCTKAGIKFTKRVSAIHTGIDRAFIKGETRRKPAILSFIMRELEWRKQGAVS